MYTFVKGIENNHLDSINEIEVLEKKYNIKFPNVLKDYYSKYDGNKIQLVKITIDGYECEIAKMVPIIAEKMFFDHIVEMDKKDGFLPSTFYPLARDRGGNYYYWDSKTENVFLVFVDDYANPLRVASSVEEFFKMLEKE